MSHIFLYGPPGSGKSTVARILARNLGLQYIDLDRVVETMIGMSIPQIMEQKGESAFRDYESSALYALANEKECVVALGGGALLRDENRTFAESNGQVLLLMAEFSTLLERLNKNSEKRPLLAGDLHQRLLSLFAEREAHYTSFPLRVQVDAMTADQNASHAQIALGRFHLSAMGEYDAIVKSGGVEQLGELLRARGLQTPIIVTDENVGAFHSRKVVDSLERSGFSAEVITIPAGEAFKTLGTINQLWSGFLEAGMDRKSTVIALGGGVIGDLAGFAASTYMRGINWIGLPTTLLSMVDASLGGKTGFDLPQGKNLIGSFHPPKLVLADIQMLQTLPEPELISGMSEVVKHGIVSDPELFALCGRGLDWVKENLEQIVRRAMAVKIKVIEEDPYEKGFRAVLNMGHTVGHAVELVSKFSLRHGEAIAIGMVAEAKYSARIGLAGKGLSDAVTESLSALGLPIQIPKELPREEIIRVMMVDKKKYSNGVRFALPVEIGKVELVDVTDLGTALDG